MNQYPPRVVPLVLLHGGASIFALWVADSYPCTPFLSVVPVLVSLAPFVGLALAQARAMRRACTASLFLVSLPTLIITAWWTFVGLAFCGRTG